MLLFLQTAGGLEETFFKSLEDLIRHYKRKNQGLAIHLRHSVKRKTALLIQPRKPPEVEPQREEIPLREEEPDYESTSYFSVFFSRSVFVDLWCIDLFSIFL